MKKERVITHKDYHWNKNETYIYTNVLYYFGDILIRKKLSKMIDIAYLKAVGIHNYLLENQMVTGFEQNIGDFIIDFERDSLSETEEKKEDARIFNTIRYTSMYRRITDELKNNKDKEEIPSKPIRYRGNKISPSKSFGIDLSKQTKNISCYGNKLSCIAKAQQEHTKKEDIRRQFEATLRELKNKKRMSNEIYENYLLYLLENIDIFEINELEEDLKLIRVAFSPSELAKLWEANEKKKDNAKHICNRKKD